MRLTTLLSLAIASFTISMTSFATEVETQLSEFFGLGAEDLYIESSTPQIFSQSEVKLTIDSDEQKIEWDLLGRVHYSRDGRKFVLLYSELARDLVQAGSAGLKLVGAVEVANDESSGLGTYGRSSIFLLAETASDLASGSFSVGPAVTISIADEKLRKSLGVQSSLKLMGESRFLYGGMIVDFFLYPDGQADIDQQLMNYQASGVMMNFSTGVKIPKIDAKIGGEWQIGRTGDAYFSYIGIRITKKF